MLLGLLPPGVGMVVSGTLVCPDRVNVYSAVSILFSCVLDKMRFGHELV